MSDLTIGSFEVVDLPVLGLHSVIAKVDTGAYSGAVHCTDIKVVRQRTTGKPLLRFTPLGRPKLATETDDFVKIYVRSSTGHRTRRYIIATTLVLQGTSYPIRIGLSDRSDMRRPVLIGRRFLRENNILVDVRINQEYDDEGENTR